MKQKLLRLNMALDIYQDDIKNDPEKAEIYHTIFLPYFDEIEALTLEALYEKNVTEARMGLDILFSLKPTCTQYKIASDFLKDSKMKALSAVMLERGLSKDSQYYKYFTYTITKDMNTGKQSQIKPFSN